MQQDVTMFQRIVVMNISDCTANHIRSNGSRLVFSKNMSRTYCCSLPPWQIDIFPSSSFCRYCIYTVSIYTLLYLLFSVSASVVSADWQFCLPMTLIATQNWEKPSHYILRHHQLRGRAICTHYTVEAPHVPVYWWIEDLKDSTWVSC